MNSNVCMFNSNRSGNIYCPDLVYETSRCQEEPSTAKYHVMGIMLTGEGRLCTRSEQERIRPGQIYYIPCQERFSLHTEDGSAYAYVTFEGRRAQELIKRAGCFSRVAVFTPRTDISGIWRQALATVTADNTHLIAEAVLLFSLSCFESSPAPVADTVSRMIAYTEDHFGDPHLSLSRLASAMKYNAKYLSHRFKTETGTAYSEYLRAARIKHAAFLFEQGVESVKSAAILSGFRDPLHFSRVFKEETGLSPSEYIASLKNISPLPSDLDIPGG